MRKLPQFTTAWPKEPGVYVAYSEHIARRDGADIYYFDGERFQHRTGWYDNALTHFLRLNIETAEALVAK